MLEINRLREIANNPTTKAEAIVRLTSKHAKQAEQNLNLILSWDEERRETIVRLEEQRAAMNAAAKQIGAAMAQGKKDEAEALKAQTAVLKAEIPTLEAELKRLEESIAGLLVTLPNLPHPTVPQGKGVDDNKVEAYGPLKAEDVKPPVGAIPHWDFARKYDIIDWELGVKITGAGFPIYKGQGARLLRGLIAFFLDRAQKAGYSEVVPPLMVNQASAFATGQLPDKDGQMYYAPLDDFYLIPTAEVPVTNLYRDELIEEKNLPIRNCAYSQCFRREAGSYGKDVRGLNRLHQFDKVEIVHLTQPENSYAALEAMRKHAEDLATALELPHRTLLLCDGDMTFSSAKTYDLEVWSAVQARWLEVSSISNFETYQSNRLKLRYRPESAKSTQLLHTLNASALALPRIMAAILENHQTEDGRVRLPKALVPYVGSEFIG
jgi:seryl-tRNA synthetase